MTPAARKAKRATIVRQASSLRRRIAEWALHASEGEREELGTALTSLRYDLDELESGNYDPSRVIGERQKSETV